MKTITITGLVLLLVGMNWLSVANAECKVRYDPSTFYRCCRLERNFMTSTVQQCMAQCTGYNLRKQAHEYWCLMVNWQRKTGECSLLYTTTAYVNDPSMKVAHGDYITATLYDCENDASSATTQQPFKPMVPPQEPASRGVGCGTAASQYKPSIPSKRIIGGNEAVRHSWPWQVSLRTSKPGFDWHFCGGTLIRVREDIEESDIVLTAAHCLTADPKAGLGNISDWTVVLGAHTRPGKYTPGEQRLRIVQYQYPDNYKDLVNDIALVRLEKSVQFTDTIRPVCLPPQNDYVPSGKLCMASGWGRNHSKENTQQDELKQALTPIHPIELCQRSWNYQGHAWGYAFLCGGALDASSATCNGDSGGPVVCQNSDGSWAQYGIASYVPPKECAVAYQPPVFSRVSSYVNWVRATVDDMSTLVKA